MIALDPEASELYDDEDQALNTQVDHRRAADQRSDGRSLGFVGREVSDHLDRGRMAEDDWEGWKMLTDRIGKNGPDCRRRPVRHQH
jgi:enolase